MPIELNQFIAHSSSIYKTLDVTYTQGAQATLTLKRSDGTTEVSLIASWTSAELEAYLQKML